VQHFLGTTPSVLLGALLLVLVASLPAPALAAPRSWLRVLVCCGSLCLMSALVWQAFDRGHVLVDAFPSSVLRYAAAELRGAQEPNVVVIEGGSYVLNGVDANIVQSELGRLGYRARVVRVAVGGANHFERYRLQEGIVQRLGGLANARQRWIYLAEVQAGYDRIPLNQFDQNQDSDRLYHYTTVDNSWNAWRAARSTGVDSPMHGHYRWALLRHTLVNAFSAGATSRYAPESSIELGGGNVSDARPKPLEFRGLDAQVRLAKRTDAEPRMLPWLREVREPRIRRLWRGYLTDFVYFGLPTTSGVQLEYVRSFCAATRLPCITPDAGVIGDLNDRKHWRDHAHLRKSGAEIYSRWLAQQLANRGVLRK
jgi:hypothetical protein